MYYKAWGETRYSTGSMNMDYQYTGQRTVTEIGLHFYNARWYDSSLGRFAQADTIIPSTQGCRRGIGMLMQITTLSIIQTQTVTLQYL
jgi:RHS repeat-associated protein